MTSLSRSPRLFRASQSPRIFVGYSQGSRFCFAFDGPGAVSSPYCARVPICASIAFMPDDRSASHLNLWKKRLGSVPQWVWERTELETLVLADNDLSEISNQVGRLKKLRMLDL